MKITHVLFAALSGASLGWAQVDCPATTMLPACGITCLVDAANAIGCGIEDIPCQCNSVANLESAADACLKQSCTAAGQAQSVTDAAAAICSSCI